MGWGKKGSVFEVWKEHELMRRGVFGDEALGDGRVEICEGTCVRVHVCWCVLVYVCWGGCVWTFMMRAEEDSSGNVLLFKTKVQSSLVQNFEQER